jgi:hypothetical protein
MLEHFKQILASQFDASLAMLNQCLQACPAEPWEGKIANDTFRQVAYHTLFWTDLYLSPGEDAFALSDLHHRGGDDRSRGGPSLGLSQQETISYLAICRQKAAETLAGETEQSLVGPSGFSWRKCSRGELHVYNIRHIQHHTGQLSAYLRRVDDALSDPHALPWIGHGWR